MHLDRPLHITTLAKQLANSDMCLDSFRIDLQGANKGLNRLVRLLIQEVIQADKVLPIDSTPVRLEHKAHLDRLPAAQKPAYGKGQHKQAQEHQFLHGISL